MLSSVWEVSVSRDGKCKKTYLKTRFAVRFTLKCTIEADNYKIIWDSPICNIRYSGINMRTPKCYINEVVLNYKGNKKRLKE